MDILGPLHFYVIFRVSLYISVRKPAGIFIGIVFVLYINLERKPSLLVGISCHHLQCKRRQENRTKGEKERKKERGKEERETEGEREREEEEEEEN